MFANDPAEEERVSISLNIHSFVSLFCAQGAFWGLLLGVLIGCCRMVLDFIYPEPLCGQLDNRPLITKHVHYLHFSILLSVFTLIMVVAISLSTKPPHPEQVRNSYLQLWALQAEP